MSEVEEEARHLFPCCPEHGGESAGISTLWLLCPKMMTTQGARLAKPGSAQESCYLGRFLRCDGDYHSDLQRIQGVAYGVIGSWKTSVGEVIQDAAGKVLVCIDIRLHEVDVGIPCGDKGRMVLEPGDDPSDAFRGQEALSRQA